MEKIKVNDIIGNLIVVEKISEKKFKLKCICGNLIELYISQLIQKNGAHKSCGCLRNEYHNNSNYKGLSGEYYNRIIRRAKNKNIEVNVDIAYLFDLFIKQNKKCALTGLELIFSKRRSNLENSASLDRIDSSKGYIKGNLQWVHKRINSMKNNMSQNDFLYFCEKVLEYNKNDKQ